MFNAKRLRRWIPVFLAVFLLTAALSPDVTAAGFNPEHVVLTWTQDPATTQTISWKTAVSEPRGQIQYAPAAAGGLPQNAAIVAAESELLQTNTGSVIIHTVTLTGLNPGSVYLYRLGNDAAWSDARSFTTAPADPAGFKFLVFGDSQSTDYDLWGKVARQAFQLNPDAAFLTVAGDLVDVGDDYQEWQNWFDASRGVIDALNIMPLTGNHETYTPVWGERVRPRLFTAQFKLPQNGAPDLKGLNYSFDYGNVHFVILDSQSREEATFAPDLLAQQKVWLAKDLAATDKQWKIAVFHKPPYNKSAGRRNNDDIRDAFTPLFDQYRVDLALNGHDHVYTRTYPLFAGREADAGTVYVTAGRSGTKFYQESHAKSPLHEFFYNPADEPCYLTVEVKTDNLTVKAFKLSGVIIDSFSIEKQTATIKKAA